jgi:hypothetical protein
MQAGQQSATLSQRVKTPRLGMSQKHRMLSLTFLQDERRLLDLTRLQVAQRENALITTSPSVSASQDAMDTQTIK